MQDLTKSPMNYTGGKYKLLPQILPLFPEKINRFFDLFCGGCDVAINAPVCSKTIANDYDKNIIQLYKMFKSMDIDSVLNYVDRKVEEYQLSKTNAEGYLKLRSDFNNGLSENKELDLFVLICHSFNNQIRFNGKNEYNMPFGKNRSSFNKNIRKNLIEFHKRIVERDIIFTDYSFVDIKTDKLKEGDFLYCDPPYLITCATYNEQDGWNETLECALYEMLDKADEKGAKFGLSNVMSNKGKENPILIEWAKKYNVHHLNKTYSNCSYHAIDKSTDTTDEVYVCNY